MDPGQAKRTAFAHQANWQDLDHLLVKLYLHLSGRFLIIQKVLLIVSILLNFKTKSTCIFIQTNTVPHLKYSLKMACLPLQVDQVQCQPKTIEQNYSIIWVYPQLIRGNTMKPDKILSHTPLGVMSSQSPQA